MSEQNRKTVPNFLRPNEVQECEEDRSTYTRMLKAREFDKRVQHQQVLQSLKAVEQRAKQAPPDLTPDQRSKADKRLKELEPQIQQGMLSHEEMRRNPPGAVAQNLRWERQNKARIHEWKNLQLALNKGMSQTDAEGLLNVARLRPRVSQLSMEGAQIPQTTSMLLPGGPAFQESWERIFGTGDSEKDELANENERLRAQLEELTAPKDDKAQRLKQFEKNIGK